MKTITRKPASRYFTLGFLLLVTACSTRTQITEYPTHHEEKLAAFTLYCWADDSDKETALEKVVPTSGHHTVFDQSIRDAINKDLVEKGYQQTNCSSADFVIDYRMGLHEDVAVVDATSRDSNINPYGPRWRIGDDNNINYEGLTEPKEDIITVRHGTIHIAAFTSDNKILWHISAEKNLREQDDDETRKANIKTAVHSMMANFPTKH